MVTAELRDLCDVVSEKLAERPVLIRWRAPFIKGYQGLAHRLPSGWPVIDLDPRLTDEGAYKLLLHELGHVVDLGDRLADNQYDLEPESHIFTPSGLEKYKSNPDEPAAESLADRWRDYGERYGWLFGPGPAGALKALRFYPSPIMERGEMAQIIEGLRERYKK